MGQKATEASYRINHERDHYEVYIDEKFYCSADTLDEAIKEAEDYIYGGN